MIEAATDVENTGEKILTKEAGKQIYTLGIEVGLEMAKQKMGKPPKVYHKSTSDEHGTPQALFDRLHQEFAFDLDPAATRGNAKCPIYFTKETNGLKQDWFGHVFVNPPYSKKQVGWWLHKLVYELLLGHIEVGVALVAARTDTEWWQIVATYASEIRFLKGRLTFEGSTNPAPFPSAVCVFDRATAQTWTAWDWQKSAAVAYWQAVPPGLSRAIESAAISAWLETVSDQK